MEDSEIKDIIKEIREELNQIIELRDNVQVKNTAFESNRWHKAFTKVFKRRGDSIDCHSCKRSIDSGSYYYRGQLKALCLFCIMDWLRKDINFVRQAVTIGDNVMKKVQKLEPELVKMRMLQ